VAPRVDPLTDFNFGVEIDGITLAAFTKVSGLAATVDVITYRNGNDKLSTVRKLPGLRTYANIVLVHGLTQNRELWDWFQQGDRRDGAIVLLDASLNDALRWNFDNAFPCKWSGPELAANTSEIAIEVLELAVEGIELAN
jgi:phage tail-like protein